LRAAFLPKLAAMTLDPAAIPSLAEVRREIDEIDDRLLALLDERFAAVARVRAAKQAEDGAGRAAFRPAREAQVLRRLLARRGQYLPPGLLVRLWRAIMGSATQAQDGLTVHASKLLLSDAAASALLNTQFGGIAACLNCAAAIDRAHVAGLAAVAFSEPFAQSLGRLQVIGTLGEDMPLVFLVGAPSLAEPSGDDETLVLADEAPAGAHWSHAGLAGLPGFLEPDATPPGTVFLGRYPRPLRMEDVS
jgi:chorismate mutase